MFSKEQIIDAITEANPSARHEWLRQFAQVELQRYLEHLRHGLTPRHCHASWIRTGETPAVVARTAA